MKQLILLFSLLLPLSSHAAGDDAIFHSGDIELDYSRVNGENKLGWDGTWWIGGDFDKLVIRGRGERSGNKIEHNELQLLYSRYISHFWDARIGVRRDFKPMKQTELAVALVGIAPYGVDTNVAAYLDRYGDLRGELELAYDIQLAQKVVSEVYFDLEWSGYRSNLMNTGHGLNQYEAGIQFRYEPNRHFGVFIDFYTNQKVGQTRTLHYLAGEKTSASGVRSGIRVFNF